MEIPLHHFTKDDETSIPFRIEELAQDSGYDTGVPHRHNYYEIFFFEKGGGEHRIDFEVLPVQSRSIHFVSPGQVHLLKIVPRIRGAQLFFFRGISITSACRRKISCLKCHF
ncbi:MAG: AraC family ligand binding domain-containing protein [Owenweeksia sp.]|nr:AraC family ligand binding domain-containing protein [Owenweeksia sp.]